MVVYDLTKEKNLHYRPLRPGVDLPEEPSSSLKAIDQNACPRLAGGLRRHLLRLEERLSLATSARRLSSMADGFLPLPPIPPERAMASCFHDTAGGREQKEQ